MAIVIRYRTLCFSLLFSINFTFESLPESFLSLSLHNHSINDKVWYNMKKKTSARLVYRLMNENRLRHFAACGSRILCNLCVASVCRMQQTARRCRRKVDSYLDEFYEHFKGSLISGLLSCLFTLGLDRTNVLTAAAKSGLWSNLSIDVALSRCGSNSSKRI